MEKKIQHFSRHRGGFKDFLAGQLYTFSSWGRMLIEVFIRKDFGERYFNFYNATTTFIKFALLPFLPQIIIILVLKTFALAMRFADKPLYAEGASSISFGWSIPVSFYGWYIYLVLFLIASYRHHKAMKRNPSVFDFARYSLSNGRIHPFFYSFEFRGRKADRRMIECWLEPAPFFLAGFMLAQIGQALGWLLMVGAVAYSASYIREYNGGDNFVMDTIDEMIINEELEKAFLGDADPDETRGYRFIGRKPNDPAKRETVYENMRESEEKVPLAK